ncbi:MAG: ABC-type transport auxiliary lipoprotein family protein, partial [Lysobacterales bacterium]
MKKNGALRPPLAAGLPIKACLLVAIAALVLTACLELGGTREFAVYGLNLDMQKRSGPAVTWQLLVDVPNAAEPVASQRIVLKPGARAYGVFEKARWTDRAPELLQALLIEGFEDSSRVIGVGRMSSSVGGDIALIGELRAFEAEFPDQGQAYARITFSAKLVHYSSSRVLTARVF